MQSESLYSERIVRESPKIANQDSEGRSTVDKDEDDVVVSDTAEILDVEKEREKEQTDESLDQEENAEVG